MEVQQVKLWLQRHHHVCVPEDWLQACIEWIQEEQEGSAVSDDECRAMVYEQWLHSDLHELGGGSLPTDILQEKYQLVGNHCLQVDSVVDVSSPYYSQLQKVKGTDNDNVSVAATQATQPKWEPKASRMLVLKMTDGTKDFHGMEYKPIPELKKDLTPGCKVLVKGPVLCRLGMMMLKSGNLHVLGGEVEALVETRTMEQQLEAALRDNKNQQENRPDNRSKQFTPRSVTGKKKDSRRPWQEPGENKRFKVEPGVKQEVFMAAEMTMEDDLLDHMDSSQLDAMEEQWEEDDLDYDAVMTQVEQKLSGGGGALGIKTEPVTQQTFHRPSELGSIDYSFSDDFDEHQPLISTTKSSNAHQQQCQWEQNMTNMGASPTVSSSVTNSSHGEDYKRSNTCSGAATQTHGKVKQSVDMHTPKLCSSEYLSLESSPHIDSQMDETAERTSPCQNSVATIIRSSSQLNQKLTMKVQPHRKDGCTSQPLQDFEPFTYIKKLLKTPSLPWVGVRYKVKAYISTLSGKLELNGGQKWTLPVKINDGSAMMEVDMSDEVLTRLIGFSAQEAMNQKKEMKKNPDLRKKLEQAIQKCQECLIELLSVRVLDMNPSLPRPQVIEVSKFTREDIVALKYRVDMKLEALEHS